MPPGTVTTQIAAANPCVCFACPQDPELPLLKASQQGMAELQALQQPEQQQQQQQQQQQGANGHLPAAQRTDVQVDGYSAAGQQAAAAAGVEAGTGEASPAIEVGTCSRLLHAWYNPCIRPCCLQLFTADLDDCAMNQQPATGDFPRILPQLQLGRDYHGGLACHFRQNIDALTLPGTSCTVPTAACVHFHPCCVFHRHPTASKPHLNYPLHGPPTPKCSPSAAKRWRPPSSACCTSRPLCQPRRVASTHSSHPVVIRQLLGSFRTSSRRLPRSALRPWR